MPSGHPCWLAQLGLLLSLCLFTSSKHLEVHEAQFRFPKALLVLFYIDSLWLSAFLFHLTIISAGLPDMNIIFSWPVVSGFPAVALTKNSVYCFHFPFLCCRVIISERLHTAVNN